MCAFGRAGGTKGLVAPMTGRMFFHSCLTSAGVFFGAGGREGSAPRLKKHLQILIVLSHFFFESLLIHGTINAVIVALAAGQVF